MILNNIDLNKLRTFSSVVKLGSYKLASEELGMTRSAISQSITTLEAQIGIQLFQRKGKKLFPTSQAVKLSKEYENSHKQLMNCLYSMKNNTGTVEGLIRIGSYFEFGKNKLVDKICTFSSLYPKSQFKLLFDSPTQLNNLLESNSIDLSFSIYPHPSSDNIKSMKILEEEFVLIAPKSLKIKTNNLDDILSYPLVDYYKNHLLFNKWIKVHYKKRRPKLNPKIYAASAEILIEFVNKGLGIGVVPMYLLKKQEEENIQIIRPSTNKLTDYIWMNYYKDQFENSAHKTFFEWIIENK